MTMESSYAGPVSPAARRLPTIAGMHSGSASSATICGTVPGNRSGASCGRSLNAARWRAGDPTDDEWRRPPRGRPPRSESWRLQPWDRRAAHCARPSATTGSAAPPWSRAAAPAPRPRARRGDAARRRRCRCQPPYAALQAFLRGARRTRRQASRRRLRTRRLVTPTPRRSRS